MAQDDVLGGQINLQKGLTGALNLQEFLRTELQTYPQKFNSRGKVKSFIIGIQEPPTREKRILGFGSSFNIFYDRSVERARACILASRNLNLWLVPEYTDGDMVTCLWRTEDETTREVYVVSVYMDITYEQVCPSNLLRLLRSAQKRRKEILILSDTNSHSTLWGCPDNNYRGEELEDVIFQFNLTVQNVGNHFTFFNRRSSTIIDVTLTTPGLSWRVNSWHVTEKVQGSDHLLICFLLTISQSDLPMVRNLNKGDWNTFQMLADEDAPPIPDVWTVEHLELEATAFESSVVKALDRSHPRRKIQVSSRPPTWWSPDLAKLRKNVKQAFSFFRLKRSADSHDKLVSARRSFSKALRRAKRKDWKDFCGEANDPKKVSLISKIVKAREKISLGILQQDDGTMCCSPEESINRLLDVHFPGSQRDKHNHKPKWKEYANISDGRAHFITQTKVVEAIRSFGSLKAPGPDGLKPFVLAHLGNRALERLTAIYKASYLLGYTPSKWRRSRVVFLPKPGKDDYSQARSFRPITLSTFQVKVMERIILWEINESYLKASPLSANQHAFRKGHSTETALSTMTSHIEGAFQNSNHALGVFLDIQGAFDNVKPASIIRGMKDKDLPKEMIKWYRHYLLFRSAEVDYQGISCIRYLNLGTPQGGVLSPLMWNLAFESLLHIYKDSHIKICGFADDAGLLICGKNLAVLQNRMQTAIDKALEWGSKAGLTFSPAKTVAVLFTRKRILSFPKELQMSRTKIPYSSSVKYLGITMDSKLTWSVHLKNKIRAAKGYLLKVKNATGKLWGISPKMSRWLYTGMVRPALSYGSLVWVKACDLQWAKKDLTRLNRLALISLGNFRKGTPTAGLEVLANVTPLDLHLKYEAVMAFRRTIEVTPRPAVLLGKTSYIGHRVYCQKILSYLDVPKIETDWFPGQYIWEKGFSICKESLSNGKPEEGSNIEAYTDGSYFNGKAGSGVYIRKGNEVLAKLSFPLCNFTTVFQSEVFAIKAAAQWLSEHCNRETVKIYTDSQAAILAISSYWFTSKLVEEAVMVLNSTSRKNPISIHWVKAHVGHKGNEEADDLAKQGCLLSHELPSVPGIAITSLKHQIRHCFFEMWSRRWEIHPACRQTKLWMPKPNKNTSFQMLQANRKEISLMVQIITGHNFLRRHSALMDPSISPECRLCMEEEETSFHVIAECPALVQARLLIFGVPLLKKPFSWSVNETGYQLPSGCTYWFPFRP